MNELTLEELRKIRSITNYQFENGVGEVLFPKDVKVTHSPSTGRIRYIYHTGDLLATLRPTDGMVALTLAGASKILEQKLGKRNIIVADNKAIDFVKKGRNLFAKHVYKVDFELRAGEEVIITNRKNKLIAVGRAILNGEEMMAFDNGVAVKVRKSVKE